MEAKKEQELKTEQTPVQEAEKTAFCVKCQNSEVQDKELDQEAGYKERFVRAIADFNNFKVRVEKDKKSWTAISKIEAIKQFLPLVDDFVRVIESAPEFDAGSSGDAWKKGVFGVCKNVETILKNLGVKEIDCSGQFDPQLHEALCKVPADNKFLSGDIVQVLRKGYTLDEVVIRHAQVSVAD